MERVQLGPYKLPDARMLVITRLGQLWAISFPARPIGSRANNRREEIQGTGPTPWAAAASLAQASAAKFRKKPAKQAQHRKRTHQLICGKLHALGITEKRRKKR